MFCFISKYLSILDSVYIRFKYDDICKIIFELKNSMGHVSNYYTKYFTDDSPLQILKLKIFKLLQKNQKEI